MKLFSLLILSALSFSASANYFEDKIDQNELAQVLLKCSAQTANVLNNSTFVSSIEGKHTKLSARVSEKAYTVTTREPRGFGMSIPGPTVSIKVVVTQPPVGSADMPSRVTYNCSVK